MVGAMMVQQVNILICRGATRTSQLGFAAGNTKRIGGEVLDFQGRGPAVRGQIRARRCGQGPMVRLGKTPRSA